MHSKNNIQCIQDILIILTIINRLLIVIALEIILYLYAFFINILKKIISVSVKIQGIRRQRDYILNSRIFFRYTAISINY